MEGYFNIKSTFSSPRVYVILDRQQVTCYASLEGSNGIFNPKNVRLTFNLRNAKIANETKVFRYGIKIISSQGNKTLAKFACLDDEMHASWFKAFDRATRLHLHEQEVMRKRQSSWQILNLDPRQKLSHNYISRSYKKLCLVNHPDRGGDVAKFNELYTAYETLRLIQEEEDRKQQTVKFDYEAVIEKGLGTIGFGLMVVEDKHRRAIVVQSVNQNILLHGLSAEADGHIKEGDELVLIDQDDCSSWPMTRVRARLSNHRVAVGAKLSFTFARRQPKDQFSSSGIHASASGQGGITASTTISPIRSSSLNALPSHPYHSMTLVHLDDGSMPSPLDSPINMQAARKFFKQGAAGGSSSMEEPESAWLGEEVPSSTYPQPNTDNEQAEAKVHADPGSLDDSANQIEDTAEDADDEPSSYYQIDEEKEEERNIDQADDAETKDEFSTLEPSPPPPSVPSAAAATNQPSSLLSEDPNDSNALLEQQTSTASRLTIQVLEAQIQALRQELLLKSSLNDYLQEQMVDLQDQLEQSDLLLDEKYSDIGDDLSKHIRILREELSAANKERRALASTVFGQRYLSERYDPKRSKSCSLETIRAQYQDREERFQALERRLQEALS
jgi:hypothetical protein